MKKVNAERSGIEPVPPNEQTVGTADFFAILFMGQMNAALIVLGALAVTVGGLPALWATAAAAVGYGFGALTLALLGQVGVDYGIAGQVALRGTFGVRGSKLFTSPLRITMGVYWFAAQAFASALAVSAILRALGVPAVRSEVLGIAIGLAQAGVALVGFQGLRAAARLALPSGIALAIIFVFLLERSGASSSSQELAVTWEGVASFVTVFWGAALTNVTNIADVCRYCRSRNSMRFGLISGALVSTTLAAGLGAYAAARIGSSNPFAFIDDVNGYSVLLVAFAVLILVQATAINSMNLYTAGMSLVNALPSLGRVRATSVVGVAAVALAGVPSLVTDANQWVEWLGNLTTPIAGVWIGDYVIRRRMQLDVEQLLAPTMGAGYSSGINGAAVLAVAVGATFYNVVPDEAIRVFWGMATGCGAYLVLSRIGFATPKWTSIRA